MLETSARLLRLLSLLQSRKDWAGADLAERLGVAPRTVRRDVERLRSLGYPVHATPGVAGGYRLGAGAALPPLLLDDDEAVAVAVGLRTAAGGGVAGIEETSVRALTKLEQVMPSRLRHRVNALQAYTVPITADGPKVDAGTLTVIAAACRDHERLRFGYLSHEGSASRRIVEPHRLVSWGRRWYLVAWDVDRQDWRTFRADRIEPQSPTGPRFVPRDPPDGDFATFVSRRLGSEVWPHEVTVRVFAPAAVIDGQTSGTVRPVDERSCLLTLRGDSYNIIATVIGMVDADFEVVEPPEFAEAVRALGDRYHRAGARTGPASAG